MKNFSSFLFILVWVSVSHAQDFEVSPVTLLFNAEPGESLAKTITITNHANKATTITLNIDEYEPGSNVVKTNATTDKRSCKNFISLSPQILEMQPNEQKQVIVNLQVPFDDYSTRWAIIYAQTAKERTSFTADKQLATGMSVSARIGVKVIQSPKSNNKYAVKVTNLKEITTDKDTARTFTAELSNIGDKTAKCKVYLVASNLATGEELQFQPSNLETFPDLVHEVKLYMPKNKLAPGRYALAAILDYGSQSALEGTQILLDVK